MEISLEGYAIIEQIAQGELCDIFLALRTSDDLKVVIKLIRSTDMDAIQRVIREQRLLKELHHPNIVKVIGTGCLGIRPYLILEYIEGQSLRDLIIKQAPLTLESTIPIVQELASAIAALHGQSVVHRDIKPENILLDESGTVKLIDLSISTKSNEQGVLTNHDTIVGTLDYMSPEQRTGEKVGKQSDQYSLAAVTFELLTGHFAIGQFRSPSDLNPQLDPAIDKVVLKGMEPFPEDRYSCVAEFANALRELLPLPKVETVSQTNVSAAYPKETNSFLNRLAISFGVAILLMLIAAVSYVKFVSLYEGPEQVANVESTRSEFALAANKFKTISNSIGMEFVKAPTGSFQFGSSQKQLESLLGKDIRPPFTTEVPQRTKRIFDPFWIGTSEVTVGQFRAFVEDSGYETTSERMAREKGRKILQPVWRDPVHFEIHEDKPVIAVSWEDANEFCKWLSEQEGKKYRLPTEVEWEYACRAGSRGPWSCSLNELGSHATFGKRWHTGPSIVRNNRPNPWGIHDMHGNVWEWCHDEYKDGTGSSIGRVSFESSTETLHVVRGGAYRAPPVTVRSASRRGFSDQEPMTDRGHGIGFRVLLEAHSVSP